MQFPRHFSQVLRRCCTILLAGILFYGGITSQVMAQMDNLPQGSSWSDSGLTSSREQPRESFAVEFQVELKGRASEAMDRITLEGETRLQNARIDQYFKQKEREYHSSGSGMSAISGANPSSPPEPLSQDGRTGDPSVLQGGTTDTWGGAWGEPMASILQAHFKLLKLKPVASTGKVTAELFLGQDAFSPHLEALEVRLNPFKKTAMEVVMSGFTKVDLRTLRVVVDLDGPVKPEWKETEFTAVFNAYLQIGEYGSGYDYGLDEEVEIQWVEEEESGQSEAL